MTDAARLDLAEQGLPAKWGCRPPGKVPEGQQSMFSLCVSCPDRQGEPA